METIQNKSLKILLVDDSEVDTTITLRAFDKAKIETNIYSVNSGENCLNFIMNHGEYADSKKYPRPDIVLLDINMPKMNGFDVLKALKDNKEVADIPVIMFTNSKNSKDIIQSYKSGASTYITKPATCSELVEVLNCFDIYWKRVGKLPQHFDDYIYSFTNSKQNEGE